MNYNTRMHMNTDNLMNDRVSNIKTSNKNHTQDFNDSITPHNPKYFSHDQRTNLSI